LSVFATKLLTLLGTGMLGLKAFSIDLGRYRQDMFRVSLGLLFQTIGQLSIQGALLYRDYDGRDGSHDDGSLLVESQRHLVYASVLFSVLDLLWALFVCFQTAGAGCTLGAYSRVHTSQEESLRMGEYGGLGDWRTLKSDTPIQELSITTTLMEPRQPTGQLSVPSQVDDEEAASQKLEEEAKRQRQLAEEVEATQQRAKQQAEEDLKEAAKEDLVIESLKPDEVQLYQRKVQMRHRLANLKLNQGQGLSSSDWGIVFSPGEHGFKCLRWLDLANNKLTDSSALSIAEGLRKGECSQLIMVGLADNAIGDEGTAAFVKALGYGRCAQLATLWLQKNGLGNKAAKELADGLGNGHCKAITLLGLSQNRIGNEGADAIAQGFGHGHCPLLKLLGLAENEITNEGALALCRSLGEGKSPAITKLSLQGNKINNAETLALVDKISRLPCMESPLAVSKQRTNVIPVLTPMSPRSAGPSI